MAGSGINPPFVNKLLPTVLGPLQPATFGVCLELPVPTAGFIATLLLNQSLWMKDDLVSAPRAFVYPLFLAFFTICCGDRFYQCA